MPVEWLEQFSAPTNFSPSRVLAYILFDVFVIIALAKFLGALMAKVRQPRVVGEILAGVMLGPTLIGHDFSQMIAPLEVRPVLGALAAFGLILFMFLAGIEFDSSRLKGRTWQAGILGFSAVALPAAIGFPVAHLMHHSSYVGPAGTEFLPFALFVGAALSVTAFPVMAHILMERGELNSPLGGLSVAAAGIMSVLMFTYIAFAGIVARSDGFAALWSQFGLILLFGVVSWWIIRPLLYRSIRSRESPTNAESCLIFAGLILFAWIGHSIGIHSMVGAFLWGTLVPQFPELRKSIADRVRDAAMILFLPIFFAVAGFAADLRSLTWETIPVLALVLIAAVAGKFLAAIPARAFGLSWREVGVLGALFNTRGLLVLVAGLIGLELEIISDLTFTITVVVALVTNLMTLPLINLFSPSPLAVRFGCSHRPAD